MKLIIAGSRHFDPKLSASLVSYACFELGFHGPQPNEDGSTYCGGTVDEEVCGGAKGIDDAGWRWASCEWIPWKDFPANWDTHGKAAGPIRNRQMAKYADELLLIWDGESKGSKSMLNEMNRLKKPVHQVILQINKDEINEQ